MRSVEIAKLAGVPVRTLRRYREVGLLPEPPRGANGYADYTTDHLVRILRIKQLASLGFPLERIGSLLDEVEAQVGLSVVDPLDDYDQQLVLRIKELEQQRRTIAPLKRHSPHADLPAECTHAAAVLRDFETSSSLPQAEKDAVLLAAQTLQDIGIDELEGAYRAITEHGLADEYLAVGRESSRLRSATSGVACDVFVARGVAFVEQLAECLSRETGERESTELELLLGRISIMAASVGTAAAAVVLILAWFGVAAAALRLGSLHAADTGLPARVGKEAEPLAKKAPVKA